MIINVTRRTILARAPRVALTFWARGRGMIARDFNGFDAMVFHNCGCVHTLFMSIPLDIVFLDEENAIAAARQNFPPWRPFVRQAGAMAVIELPAGTLAATGTRVGDKVDLNAELTLEEKEKLRKRPAFAATATNTAISCEGRGK